MSDSTCEKSGLIAASTAVSGFGIHLMSPPPLGSTGWFRNAESGFAGSRGAPSSLAETYGAITKCCPDGRFSNPVSSREKQIRQLDPRGCGLE